MPRRPIHSVSFLAALGMVLGLLIGVLLPRSLASLQDTMERFGPFLLIGLVFFDYLARAGIFSSLFGAVSAFVFRFFS